MEEKECPSRLVLYEGKDVTPKHLGDPFVTTPLEILQIDFCKKDTLSSKCNATDVIECEISNLEKEIEIVDEAVSKDKPGMEIPAKLAQNLKCGILKILLRETRTMKLLHIDSIITKKEDSESNEDKHLKVVVNGERREMEIVSSETQTLQNPMRDQSTITVPVMKKVSQFKYKVEKLWAFSCESTQKRTVTSLSWNPIIEGNIAVGYGTFDFCNPTTGLLCIWSILNPCQPEQTHKFQSSVTDAKFSNKYPHFIAVGCYDGAIWIVDISLNSKMMIDGHQLHHLGPVWKLDWVLYDDFLCKEELLVSVGNDGRVCKWDIFNKLGCSLLLHLRYSPEKQLKPLIKEDMIVGNHHLSGLSFSVDPVFSDMYYVGTGEGFLVKCSTNLHDDYKDIMMAHLGPVYSVNFSPFCPKIILTCGGDWTMRLWITGVMEPILIIHTAMEAVMQAVWSPVHSTIIVSISGNELALWDISRKMAYPLRVVSISCDLLFSTVEFTRSGDEYNTVGGQLSTAFCMAKVDYNINIIAGDDDGNVHVYNLQEMPHSPYHQTIRFKSLHTCFQAYISSLTWRLFFVREHHVLSNISMRKYVARALEECMDDEGSGNAVSGRPHPTALEISLLGR
ncbi:hypothetical protein J437_LFUL010146 [Ladona fulva]|uniref:Dynein axonemal intermediate chain 4 n=1 Tax=Ladona fulva TaxID=123851 RepID=A0A8K0P1G6_LADFU|nr:hypothetical protein J437_LFUL010146 [Ladona fulva]